MPPATRKAGIEMPTKFSTASPNRANTASTQVAVMQARRAMARRAWAGRPWVSATNSGASPGGSITTNMVTKAVMTKVQSMWSRWLCRGIGPRGVGACQDV